MISANKQKHIVPFMKKYSHFTKASRPEHWFAVFYSLIGTWLISQDQMTSALKLRYLPTFNNACISLVLSGQAYCPPETSEYGLCNQTCTIGSKQLGTRRFLRHSQWSFDITWMIGCLRREWRGISRICLGTRHALLSSDQLDSSLIYIINHGH